MLILDYIFVMVVFGSRQISEKSVADPLLKLKAKVLDEVNHKKCEHVLEWYYLVNALKLHHCFISSLHFPLSLKFSTIQQISLLSAYYSNCMKGTF